MSLEIAIVGMAGKFPGANTLPEFWRNLEDGIESIRVLSEEELLAAGVAPSSLADPRYVRACPVLEDADKFDAAFFGYTAREARLIDPQHRVLLECAWKAMEHAGYDVTSSANSVGIVAGCSMNSYLLFNGMVSEFLRDYVLTLSCSDKDFLATRIAYKLNLQGPALTVQTACSTSLVAVHLACRGLLYGECDMALAGGACVKVPLISGYGWRDGGMFSRDGHVRAFDAKATGTVFGSGAAMVVLKRLEDALRDNDTIHAVIKGSAINNDGSAKATYTAPSVDRQAEVIIEALANAEVEASSISYIEAHGTGTLLGDPIEVAALTKAFRVTTDAREFCAIGSIKTNIGHLEAAAGISGLVKVVLALNNEMIPASLNYQCPNPDLDFGKSPFYVN